MSGFDFSDAFVTLRCPQCQGEIELDQPTYSEHFTEAGGMAIYIGHMSPKTARCKHCNTAFVQRQALDVISGGGNTMNVMGNKVGGSQYNIQMDNVTGAVIGNNAEVTMDFGSGGWSMKTGRRKGKYCTGCGDEILQGAKFCSGCGQKV